MEMIKSTFNINKEYKEKLEFLVSEKKISSITEGLNEALELYFKERQRKDYEEKMAMAAIDKAFMKRTMMVQEEFERLEPNIDNGDDEW